MEESQDQCFRVYDATGFFILSVCHREDLHASRYTDADRHLSQDEARRIAEAISRLQWGVQRIDPERLFPPFVVSCITGACDDASHQLGKSGA